MSQEKHLMLDIECLSTDNNAIITNIGYAIFKPGKKEISDSGNIYLDIREQCELGRTVSPRTLDFWFNQDRETQRQVASSDRVSLDEALAEFSIKCVGITKAWAKSTNFDMTILESLYKDMGIDWPIHYSKYTDVRSFYWLSKYYKIQHKPQLNKHDAEHDAVFQANVLMGVLEHIEGRG